MDVDDKVEALERDARDRAGLSDFGGSHYREALRAWADDLLHAPLTDFARGFLERLVVRNLVTRLGCQDWLARHPEIDDVPLPPIVLIVGPPRTGTTLLHNLMALHERARPLLRWELVEPVPPPERATYATDPRIDELQRSLEGLRGSLLERMHWVNADEPEECPWGWVDCRGLLGQGVFASMPSWTAHLDEHDFRVTFREQARLMRMRLWRNPPPPDAVLLLKSPQTCQRLVAFMDVFPDAKLVLTHRDPYRSLLSTLTVVDAINSSFTSGDHALTDDGRRQRRGLQSHCRQLDALCAVADRPDVTSVDVHYPRVMEDPKQAVLQTWHALGVPPDPQLPERIEAFLHAQKAGKRAKPPSSYDDFGYDHDGVLGQPAVRRYLERFALQPERSRLSATRLER